MGPVRCARTKHPRSGAAWPLLCNLSASPKWGGGPRTAAGAAAGRPGRRGQRPKGLVRGRGAGGGAAHLAPPKLRCLGRRVRGRLCGGWGRGARGVGAAARNRGSRGVLASSWRVLPGSLPRGPAFWDLPSSLALLSLPLSRLLSNSPRHLTPPTPRPAKFTASAMRWVWLPSKLTLWSFAAGEFSPFRFSDFRIQSCLGVSPPVPA